MSNNTGIDPNKSCSELKIKSGVFKVKQIGFHCYCFKIAHTERFYHTSTIQPCITKYPDSDMIILFRTDKFLVPELKSKLNYAYGYNAYLLNELIVEPKYHDISYITPIINIPREIAKKVFETWNFLYGDKIGMIKLKIPESENIFKLR